MTQMHTAPHVGGYEECAYSNVDDRQVISYSDDWAVHAWKNC